MQVTEVFYSIQGEGRKMGRPTVFVRSTGCHLRCTWCDAAYAFHGGEKATLDELMAKVAAHPTDEVCFTGGEPLLQKDAWPFIRRLLDSGRQVVVETSGSIDVAPANALPAPARERLCISLDVKCPGSGMAEHNRLDLLAALRPSDQLKFVIADRADYDFAAAVVRKHGPLPCPVFFNPVGGTDVAGITHWLLAEKEPLGAQVGLQMHKLVWGDAPGH